MSIFKPCFTFQNLSKKDKYLNRWIPISAPWIGAAKLYRIFATGDNEGINIVKSLYVRGEQRSYETNLWLLPRSSEWDNQTFVSTPNRNYSASNLQQFFEDVGYPLGYTYYLNQTVPLTESIFQSVPGVPISGLYGTGVKTPLAFYYQNDKWDADPKIEYGDGDGTVNLQSSLFAETAWCNQTQPVHFVSFPGNSHTGILKNQTVFKYIASLLKS